VRKDTSGRAQLDFDGVDLVLRKLTLNTADLTATTGSGILPKRELVDLKVASTPPGPVRGIAFSTPDETIERSLPRKSGNRC